MLKSESFCSDVNDFWVFWQTQRGFFTDPRVWWDAGKLQLKELSISHSIQRANNRKKDKAALEREFRHALDRPPSPHISARLLLLKEQLTALDDELVSGSIIRSKEQWTELGEKPTRYFFQLEVKRQTRNAIHALRVDNTTVSATRDILAACDDFYRDLYSVEPVDMVCQDRLLGGLNCSLSTEEQKLCEGELTETECQQAVMQMQTGKSPGSDGFPVDFYLRFWCLLGEDLTDTLNHCFRTGFLSTSQRTGILEVSYFNS